MKKKRLVLVVMCLCVLLGGCGLAKEEETANKIEGDLGTVMDEIFTMSQLDPDFMEAYNNYYMKDVIVDKESLLGTNDIEFKEGYYAVPSMSATAFQAVLLRLNDNQDPEEVKKILLDNADPRKWVCVEPEVIRAENVGDVIFFLMCDKENGDALMESFLSMK